MTGHVCSLTHHLMCWIGIAKLAQMPTDDFAHWLHQPIVTMALILIYATLILRDLLTGWGWVVGVALALRAAWRKGKPPME